MFKTIITSLIFIGTLKAWATGQAETAVPSTIDSECRQFIDSLAPEARFGFIDVPENWARPRTSRKISVFYYYFNSQPANGEKRTPIVFFNGGPGFNSHVLAPLWKVKSEQIQTPLLTLDQRGTGCSSNYPIVNSNESFNRLQYYGSRAIAQDAEAIRKKVFGQRQKWKVFGQSYGSFLVHRYTTMFPQNITAAYAHGMALSTNPLGNYFFRVLGQHRLAADYFRNYPNDYARVVSLRRQLTDTTCFYKNSFGICGEGMWDGIAITLLGINRPEELHTSLERLMDANLQVKVDVLEELVTKHIFSLYAHDSAPSTDHWPMSGPAYIGDMEMQTGQMDPADPNNCRKIISYLSSAVMPEHNPINECRFVLGMRYTQTSASQPVPTMPSIVRDTLTLTQFQSVLNSRTSPPFYLYSGAKDAFVPTELFQEEKALLGARIQYTNFANSAHDGFASEEQIWADLQKH